MPAVMEAPPSCSPRPRPHGLGQSSRVDVPAWTAEQAEAEDLCRRRIRGRVVGDERRGASGKRKLGPKGAERYDI